MRARIYLNREWLINPKSERVTIGMDVEFEYLNRMGSVDYPPSGVISHSFRSSIGRDGNSAILELRPNWGYNEEEVVRNMKHLIEKCPVRIGVEGNKLSIGAHIHLGNFMRGSGIERAIHEFLSPIAMRKNGQARLSEFNPEYGPNVRDKPWGIEYRNLPSSIVFHPEMTRIVLKLVRRIAEEMLDKGFIGARKNLTMEISDYAPLIGERDAVNLLWFTINQNIPGSGPINKNWTGTDRRYIGWNDGIAIEFIGKWNGALRERIVSQIRSSEIGNVDALVVLYGISVERGSVVKGLAPPSGYRRDDDIPCPSRITRGYRGRTFYFGFAYDLRQHQKWDDSLMDLFMDSIESKVLQSLEEYDDEEEE